MFLQPDWFDVLKPGVGTNRFSYSFNDPVNLSDPSGNCPMCIPIIVGAAIGYFSSADPANAPGPSDALLPSNGEVGLLAAGAVGIRLGAQGVVAGVNALAARAPGLFIAATDTAAVQATSMVAGTAGAAAVAGTKILGTPQVTRGVDGLIHAATSVKVAIEQAIKVGPGNVVSINFNRSLSSILGIVDRRRPDVTILTRGGCVIICEIASKTQTLQSQLDKAASMARNIVSGTGSTTSVVVRGLDRSTQGGGWGISSLKSLLGIK